MWHSDKNLPEAQHWTSNVLRAFGLLGIMWPVFLYVAGAGLWATGAGTVLAAFEFVLFWGAAILVDSAVYSARVSNAVGGIPRALVDLAQKLDAQTEELVRANKRIEAVKALLLMQENKGN